MDVPDWGGRREREDQAESCHSFDGTVINKEQNHAKERPRNLT